MFPNSGIVDIEIPKSVKKIGKFCFSKCKNLKKVTINHHIIPQGCFMKSSVSEVVMMNVKELCNSSFAFCKNLHSIMLPKTLRKINGFTFAESGIKNITIPPNVIVLGDSCFWCCESLEKVILSEGLQEIKNSCFANSSIKEIKIPDSVKYIKKMLLLDLH